MNMIPLLHRTAIPLLVAATMSAVFAVRVEGDGPDATPAKKSKRGGSAADERDPDFERLRDFADRDPEAARELLVRLRRGSAGDWQALFRLGVILTKSDRVEAQECFRELLALDLPDDNRG